MRKTLTITFLFFILIQGYAQIGINTNTPDTFAVLEIFSDTKGLLIPRVETSAREGLKAINTPNGLLVYDSVLKKFFAWNLYRREWVYINPWYVNDTDKNMSLTTDIADTVKIDGDLLLNGTVSTNGSEGYTGIINPDIVGSRIIIKNGIIIEVEGGEQYKIIFDPYDDYDVDRTGTVAYVSETNLTWVFEKDMSHGNPDAFDVDPPSGIEGLTNFTFTANLNGEFGETKFLFKEGSTVLEEIVMNSIRPSGNVVADQPDAPVFGDVTFSPGTGSTEWVLEISQGYGNPDAIGAAPSSASENKRIYFYVNPPETGSTMFLLKSGGTTLDAPLFLNYTPKK